MATSHLFSRSFLHCISGLTLSLCLHGSGYAQQAVDGDSAAPRLTSAPQQGMAARTDSDIAANNSPEERKLLQQELRALLTENSRINQEKIQYLETQSRRVFWTKCLIGFLIIMMLGSLISFWRLHVQHQFQHGIDALSTSLKHFQDSLFSLSFIDTSQLSTAANLSSFHITGTDADTTVAPANSVFRKTLNPNTGAHRDEFSDIRGFFDAWLNVYKPGDPRYEEALAAANKPKSARPWLDMLEAFLHNKDQHGFESISKEIKKFFNVKLQGWQIASATASVATKQLSDYPHVVQKIMDLWPSDEVVVYLERLLNNSRMSPREGFDLCIFEQLESLLVLAQTPNRPRQLNQLKELNLANFLFQPLKVLKPEADMIDLRMTQQSSAKSVNDAVATRDTIINVKEHSDSSNGKLVQEQAAIQKVEAHVQDKSALNIGSQSHEQLPQAIKHQTVANLHTAADAAPKVTTIVAAEVVADVATEVINQVVDEESLFAANEVRLQLALAYREIADTEGACLLLEDVIREAAPAQQAQARQMLADIEKKQARICGDSEEIYFADNSALTAAKKA